MARKGLGRGLSTLLGEKEGKDKQIDSKQVAERPPGAPSPETGGASSLPTTLIDANPYQPRTEVDAESLDELTQSVKNHGILEPLLVRRNPDDPERFQLIAGERRLRAAQAAQLDRVPVLVREVTDLEMMEMALVENVQRENLNPIEEAEGYRRLLDATRESGHPIDQEGLAQKVGKSRTTVANLLRLLDLPDYVQETIRSGLISQGHGKILAGLDSKQCKEAWNFVLKQGASVRALENFLKAKKKKPERDNETGSSSSGEQTEDPIQLHLRSVEEALRERFRAKVKVTQKKDQSGTIQIRYHDNEELTRILESVDIEL